jgi:hypothetical protein
MHAGCKLVTCQQACSQGHPPDFTLMKERNLREEALYRKGSNFEQECNIKDPKIVTDCL